MIFYYVFKSRDLDNLFVLEDGFSAANWQFIYKKSLAYYSPHLIDALGVHQQELDNNSHTENVEQDDVDDVKYKELLGIQKSHNDGFQFELEIHLGQHLQDKEYNRLAPNCYSVNIDLFSKSVGFASSVASQNAPKTLLQARDISILNAG